MKHTSHILSRTVGTTLLLGSLFVPAFGKETPSNEQGIHPREVVLSNGLTLLLGERHD